jgi:peroxiredoxin
MSLAVGSTAPFFQLKNAHPNLGQPMMSLEDAKGPRGVVVVFECNHCPYVVASVGRMNDLSEYCQSHGIGFIGINSNDAAVYANDSFEHMVKRAEKGMPYPYLYDESQSIAHEYGAVRTPEFFLFDSNNSLIYRGRMDDSPKDPHGVTQRDLKDAIDAMLAGRAPHVSTTDSIGCSVKWKA